MLMYYKRHMQVASGYAKRSYVCMYVCPSCIEFYLHTVLRASGLTAKDANGIHDIPELTPYYFV